ncbi:anti-sigma factor [Aestuariivivens marinum]|uniref:anti-sigma factor n=1 Tax=Aestuariivivens marinum TaxID=2913555 RepID=UPI001F5AC005|nr:anti-sigma factor [Aestuariivivens marinum]
MDEKINTFLDSGLLEKYLIGTTTIVETEQVEAYISKYPEVQNAYNTMQFNLEVVAKSNAVEAPKDILNAVLDELDDTPVVNISTFQKYKSWYKIGVAACVASIIFASTSFMFFKQNQKLSNYNHLLSEENQTVVDELFDLRSDIEENNAKLDAVMQQFVKLNDPETYKYIIQGNNRASKLKTVAYINPRERTSMIDVVSLPELPEEQCFQIWAELQGKMVSLGILTEEDRQLRAIPYTEDALALNITIEPKGGNSIASLDNSVAHISLQ